MSTLVVIPTYQEASTIEKTVSEVRNLYPEISILVVDDGSPDGTSSLVRQMAGFGKSIFLLERESKQGLGQAYLAGFDWGFERQFKVLVEMDADGSHRAQDLSKLLLAIHNADLVIGSRWVPGGQVQNWPRLRMMVSKLGNAYAKLVLSTSISDMTSGFRVYGAEFLKSLLNQKVSSQGYAFQVELAYRAFRSGRVVEVPITFVERLEGKSKMTLAIVLEALAKVTLWGIRRLKP